MKNMFRFSALLCAMAILVTSCTKDETLEQKVTPAADGSEIIFGARAGFENANPDTRTIYSGVDYTYGGASYERIDWVFDTDQIEIYSPHTANAKNTFYQVKDAGKDPDETIKEGETHLHDYAYLQRMSDSDNLEWKGDGDHTFYAMYPSERMFDEPASEANGWVGTTVEMGIEMNKTVLTGVIPSVQMPTEISYDESTKTYTAKPDMRYAYMAAKTTANRANGGNVGLTFIPMVTAVEVELSFPAGAENTTYYDAEIGEIAITAGESQPIAGEFTANLENWDGKSFPTPTETSTIFTMGTTQTSIQITTRKYDDDLGIDAPIRLNVGETLKFTVFLLPNQNVDKLCISFSGTGAGSYLSKTIYATDTEGNSLTTIPAGMKTRITKIQLPAVASGQDNPFQDASNWMADLKDDVTFRRLSLPGTGGSFSYNYTAAEGEDRGTYAEQFEGMNLEAQWKLGIRAFEVIVNRPSDGNLLADEYVKCNKTSMKVKFDKVMTDLTTWVSEKYPDECAVVILTYQPEGNDPNRNCESFASSLHTWYEGFANKTILKKYTPDMTIANARSHVMVLVRANQTDEKDGGTYANAAKTLAGDPFVLINGAGTAKDRWGARGYRYTYKSTYKGSLSGESVTDDSGYFPHISNSYSDHQIIEWYMNRKELFTTTTEEYSTTATETWTDSGFGWSRESSYTINRAEPGKPDQLKFGFYTGNDNAETGNATICWFQEWHRVVASPVKGASTWLGGMNVTWFESYYEKLDNVKTTYDMAVSGDERYKNYIFVNSLCGYLAEEAPGTTTSTGSEYGGSGGNYVGLAEKINPAFYQYVYQRSQENTQGPTGIVMMDYVTNDSSLPHYYLPGLIIANNRKTGNAK